MAFDTLSLPRLLTPGNETTFAIAFSLTLTQSLSSFPLPLFLSLSPVSFSHSHSFKLSFHLLGGVSPQVFQGERQLSISIYFLYTDKSDFPITGECGVGALKLFMGETYVRKFNNRPAIQDKGV